ncbi:MAG: hypothetical protein RMZ41_005930 [Nostoc sp. DedVER02]|uniref:hypothetical protein n=1 Tax=unclassified Nostoc TaxID=2593658 RepID=UPI002AD4A6F8|nr:MULTISPECIES: hypothetical protein [unclassified Nostoc]MDZ7985801.1 hypothetical protein [Nostoc sp. DedVER02]MDZ8114636.1 hypothetical protein [Nostoc sp. DedVER01b]
MVKGEGDNTEPFPLPPYPFPDKCQEVDCIKEQLRCIGLHLCYKLMAQCDRPNSTTDKDIMTFSVSSNQQEPTDDSLARTAPEATNRPELEYQWFSPVY